MGTLWDLGQGHINLHREQRGCQVASRESFDCRCPGSGLNVPSKSKTPQKRLMVQKCTEIGPEVLLRKAVVQNSLRMPDASFQEPGHINQSANCQAKRTQSTLHMRPGRCSIVVYPSNTLPYTPLNIPYRSPPKLNLVRSSNRSLMRRITQGIRKPHWSQHGVLYNFTWTLDVLPLSGIDLITM